MCCGSLASASSAEGTSRLRRPQISNTNRFRVKYIHTGPQCLIGFEPQPTRKAQGMLLVLRTKVGSAERPRKESHLITPLPADECYTRPKETLSKRAPTLPPGRVVINHAQRQDGKREGISISSRCRSYHRLLPPEPRAWSRDDGRRAAPYSPLWAESALARRFDAVEP